jgi:hypothetical protein
MASSNGREFNDDAAFAIILAELSKRLEAGEPIDLDSCRSRYPQHANELCRLLPVLKRLANLSHTGQDSAKRRGT